MKLRHTIWIASTVALLAAPLAHASAATVKQPQFCSGQDCLPDAGTPQECKGQNCSAAMPGDEPKQDCDGEDCDPIAGQDQAKPKDEPVKPDPASSN